VVIVEDVITTGGSALKAIEALNMARGEVIGVLGLVDREEGGRAAIEATGLTTIVLYTATELKALLQTELEGADAP
jgi:orotate phosphoribosyltransferase